MTVAAVHARLEHLEESELRGWQRPDAGEVRWPVSLAVVAALALQLTLPDRLSIGPSWLLPAIEGAVGLSLLVANPRRVGVGERDLRVVAIGLVAVLSLANGWSSGELIREILDGRVGKSAAPLFADGAAIYLTNIIAFSLWYWESDRGGPAARARGEQRYPEFLFPQMTEKGICADDWRPTYVDYLYTAFTNATAFSPTDVMPLTRWAKLLMALQSAVALSIGTLVIARAVNILS